MQNKNTASKGITKPTINCAYMDILIPRNMFTGYYGNLPDRNVNLFLTNVSRVSSGTFGIVYRADLYEYPIRNKSSPPSTSTPQKPQVLAVKLVLEDKRFKNRELEIARILDHKNIVSLKYYYKTICHDNTYLGLIMEYIPINLYTYTREIYNNGKTISEKTAKSFSIQLLSAMEYIHKQDICHRDIKPQNILIDSVSEILKVCDFGSAKRLVCTESNVSYICSRHYRAPELILGETFYSTSIDIWACGCVMCEMLVGKTLFIGQSSHDQLAQIISIIGVPDVYEVKRRYANYKLNEIQNPKKLKKVLNSQYKQFVKIVKVMLSFFPEARPSASEILKLPYFSSPE